MRTWSLAIGLLAAGGLAACGEDALVEAPCTQDTHCGGGMICEGNECIPASALSCASVAGGTPILQPDPARIAFPTEVVGFTSNGILLRNVGNCTLTIFEVFLEKGEDSPFECTGCEAEGYPHEIFPMRDLELEVAYDNREVGVFEDNLVLLSDDAEFPEIKIPLRAHFEGVPEVRVVPTPVDFGYVALGRQATQRVGISNAGVGTATVGIVSVKIDPEEGSPFVLPAAFGEAVTLAPLHEDRNALLEVEVRYQPRDAAVHEAALVIETDRASIPPIRVPLHGNSETPPKIRVAPEVIEFGEVNLGQTARGHLTIVNEGGAPLSVNLHWEGSTTTDLSVQPNVVPDVAPGDFVELNVLAAPTVEGPINALLVIDSNDPSRPSIAVPVSAIGRDLGQAVVKIELNYDNGNDGTFDEDLRNVDMGLESPLGLVCNKDEPDPATWADHGQPHWMQLGPKGEPERVVLVGAQRNGTYRVFLSYQEDCAFIPTGLLASLLGISADLLIGYITGGIAGGNADDIADAIAQACFDHSGTTAQLTVWVNGSVVTEKSVPLGSKGDFLYALDLEYRDGVFTAR